MIKICLFLCSHFVLNDLKQRSYLWEEKWETDNLIASNDRIWVAGRRVGGKFIVYLLSLLNFVPCLNNTYLKKKIKDIIV